MRYFIATFMALAAITASSSAASGQQMHQTAYSTPPEPPRHHVYTGLAASAYVDEAPVASPQPVPSPACGCSSGCSDCAASGCSHCCASKCCYGCCLHRTGAFGELLFLEPRNIDMPFAVPQDGIGGIGTVPVGDVGVLDHERDTGFRVGFNLAIDCNSSLTFTYTWFDTETDERIQVGAPNVIQPLVMFPGTFNAGFTGQAAEANYSLEYQFFDVDYRSVLWSCQGSYVNWVVGGRYAHLEQGFDAIFPFAPPDGTTFVASGIEFDGGGIRFGLEGERRLFRHSGLSVYGKGYLNLLAGEFDADYVQINQFNGTEAVTGINDDRVISISELELGLAWTNYTGNVRLGVGYYFAIWDNVITTPEWIDAVQNLNFTDVGQDDNDTIAFDGLVLRAELLF